MKKRSKADSFKLKHKDFDRLFNSKNSGEACKDYLNSILDEVIPSLSEKNIAPTKRKHTKKDAKILKELSKNNQEPKATFTAPQSEKKNEKTSTLNTELNTQLAPPKKGAVTQDSTKAIKSTKQIRHKTKTTKGHAVKAKTEKGNTSRAVSAIKGLFSFFKKPKQKKQVSDKLKVSKTDEALQKLKEREKKIQDLLNKDQGSLT